MTNYLTKWVEETPVKDYTTPNAMKFLFETVLTRLGFPNILINAKCAHFLNKLVEELTEEFHIQHRRTMQYDPQANGVVKAFNKILENALTKVFNV